MDLIEIHFIRVKEMLLRTHASSTVTLLIKKGVKIGKYPEAFLKFLPNHPKKSILRNKFSNNWKLKGFINQRDNHECQRCGSKRWLEVHHILSIEERPDLVVEPSNLILLCRKCHRGLHCGKLR